MILGDHTSNGVRVVGLTRVPVSGENIPVSKHNGLTAEGCLGLVFGDNLRKIE